MTLLADIDPQFLAWLRVKQYINGLGPRRWKGASGSVVIPFHFPTPSLTALFEQHDADYLFGGTDGTADLPGDRQRADDKIVPGMLRVADTKWWPLSTLIRRAAQPTGDWCRHEGWKHFREREAGPRTQLELARQLAYPNLTTLPNH